MTRLVILFALATFAWCAQAGVELEKDTNKQTVKSTDSTTTQTQSGHNNEQSTTAVGSKTTQTQSGTANTQTLNAIGATASQTQSGASNKQLMNVTGDRTMPGGMATIGYDDDGVKTTEFPIIRDGILVGLQTNRETAPQKQPARKGRRNRIDQAHGQADNPLGHEVVSPVVVEQKRKEFNQRQADGPQQPPRG